MRKPDNTIFMLCDTQTFKINLKIQSFEIIWYKFGSIQYTIAKVHQIQTLPG